MRRPLFALLMVALLGCSNTTTKRPMATTSTAPGTNSPAPSTSSTAPSTSATAPPTTRSTASPSTSPTSSAVAAGPVVVCGSAAAAPAVYQHVVWVWMENHTWGQVLGRPADAPYETGLAHQCGTATNYHSVGSPSLPNYIGATSGSTQGIGDDASPSAHPLTVDNLFRQVRTAGKSERSYEEAMTSPCQLNSSGQYAVKHNPAAYYVGDQDRAACGKDDVPLSAFQADLAAGHLPAFSFVTPDLCHDTHDCSVQTGDRWLAGWLPPLLNSPEYRSGTTAVIVMWDEETPMPNLMIAPSVSPATVTSTRFDHFSLLATTEQLLGIPALTAAPSMRGTFRL